MAVVAPFAPGAAAVVEPIEAVSAGESQAIQRFNLRWRRHSRLATLAEEFGLQPVAELTAPAPVVVRGNERGGALKDCGLLQQFVLCAKAQRHAPDVRPATGLPQAV